VKAFSVFAKQGAGDVQLVRNFFEGVGRGLKRAELLGIVEALDESRQGWM
jgi:hypothetical protein